MISKKQEALYLVDNQIYLHLKETTGRAGFAYETFDNATGTAEYAGLIPYADMLDNPIRNPLACARVMAIQEIGLDGIVVAGVALRTLERLKDARAAYRRSHMDEPEERSIRFITSNYDELFRLPDGGKVRIEYPDQSFIAPCTYIDDYHAQIGGEVYHICQFAELLERGKGKASPEPEMLQDQAAWQLAHREYLSIRATEGGWEYSIYDKSFGEEDDGQIDLKKITILECRDMILQDRGWQNRTLVELDYSMVEDRAADVAEEKLNSVLEQLHQKRMAAARSADAEALPRPSVKEKSEECL